MTSNAERLDWRCILGMEMLIANQLRWRAEESDFIAQFRAVDLSLTIIHVSWRHLGAIAWRLADNWDYDVKRCHWLLSRLSRGDITSPPETLLRLSSRFLPPSPMHKLNSQFSAKAWLHGKFLNSVAKFMGPMDGSKAKFFLSAQLCSLEKAWRLLFQFTGVWRIVFGEWRQVHCKKLRDFGLISRPIFCVALIKVLPHIWPSMNQTFHDDQNARMRQRFTSKLCDINRRVFSGQKKLFPVSRLNRV